MCPSFDGLIGACFIESNFKRWSGGQFRTVKSQVQFAIDLVREYQARRIVVSIMRDILEINDFSRRRSLSW